MEGFILLHRKLMENAIFYNPNYFQVWIYILLKVNHKDQELIWNGEKRIISKGCGIFSQKKISESLKISIGTVSNALKYLQRENQVEIKSTNKFTEIKVVKWDEYQDLESIIESRLKARRKQGESTVKQTNMIIHDKHDNIGKMPTLEEVIIFFQEKGFSKELAERAFNHYDLAGWKDSTGKKVKNWKQKMNTVWCKEDNKPKRQKVNGANGVVL